jgi:hypothetical protein
MRRRNHFGAEPGEPTQSACRCGDRVSLQDTSWHAGQGLICRRIGSRQIVHKRSPHQRVSTRIETQNGGSPVDLKDRRIWYAVAAVIIVLIIIGYATGWFGGEPALPQ